MAQEIDYKKAFEWVCNQIEEELKWTNEDILELMNSGLLQTGVYNAEYDSLRRLHGSRFAYESIKELCDNIKKYGVDGYEKKCDEVVKKYSEI